MSYDREIIIGIAKQTINRMEKGRKANVHDMLSGHEEYDTLSKNDKMGIGRMISNEVDSNNLITIRKTGNKKNNSIEYERI